MAGHSGTLRTTLGFLRAFFKRRFRLAERSESLEDIYNYVRIDGVYSTSGQPSEQQFQLIKAAGFETVINLAPNSILENALIDELGVLAELGMTYVHIPVDFKNPTATDFEKFIAAVEQVDTRTLWVHCAANMRVSAFTYRYRCEVLGEPPERAEMDLAKIWQPMGVWRRFVRRSA